MRKLIGYAPDGIETFNPDGSEAGPSPPIDSATATWTEITGNFRAERCRWRRRCPCARFATSLQSDGRCALSPHTPPAAFGSSRTPAGTFTTAHPPVWTEVGFDPVNGNAPTMPIAPVTALSLSTTTGILGAATYGRGVYEIQVRGLISGEVFTDTNGNGVLDAGEKPQANTTVEYPRREPGRLSHRGHHNGCQRLLPVP